MLGYRVELGSNTTHYTLDLEDKLKHSLYFKNTFSEKAHFNFLGGTAQNPVCVSALIEEKVKGGHKWRILVRTKKDDFYLTIEASSKKKMLKYLCEGGVEIFGTDIDFYEVSDQKAVSSLIQDLVHMEDRLFIKAYKFGVVYCKKGQTNEEDMFSNAKPSKLFSEFMDMIGTKTKLQGYKGYKGGLDTENNTTGSHAYVTHFQGFDILYHCSTLLPISADNTQQIARKRHIGNDVVVIVFQDGPTGGFSPDTISSKFNHIYLVVQAVGKKKSPNGEKVTQYQIAIVSKQGVRIHGPPLPAGALFPCCEETREYLLTKLINAERAAYYAPGFAQSRTRRLWLKDILEKYGKPQKK
eukprot:TRINITY_DN3502_c0_g1_i5.p1 TRINITY_DN3502_c0_g1~~TRINITY_DN3502_c0_g1_i5.p1  ORF type:complete len:354 (-),score=58.62 TRINITY_DN3502_c0_g1_i5:53-1114(-)